MRILLIVRCPHEPFNTLVRNGTAAEKMKTIVEDAKPESIYFTEIDGLRTAVMVVNLDDASQIPVYAEPWFLNFEADIEFHPAMIPSDLEKADLGALAQKWG